MLAIKPTAATVKTISKLRNTADIDTPEMGKAFKRIGLHVNGLSKEYAPISPTKAQGGGKKAAPGGLQNSINHQVIGTNAVDIFVPTNGPAKDYAHRMHEERFVAWQDRGAGTVAKGVQAKEKFIERAINDSETEIIEFLEHGILKSFGAI